MSDTNSSKQRKTCFITKIPDMLFVYIILSAQKVYIPTEENHPHSFKQRKNLDLV